MEKKKASAAAMKQTWSFGDDEHEMSELKRSPSGYYFISVQLNQCKCKHKRFEGYLSLMCLHYLY